MSQQDKTQVPVSDNVGWLDLTHGLTFANAVRRQCSRFPELWPSGEPARQMNALIEKVLDHGQGEHIVAVHLLKKALAVREEMALLEPADADILLAALARFFASPLKRRQARRTAYQSLKFVDRE